MREDTEDGGDESPTGEEKPSAEKREWTVSEWADSKQHQGLEEDHDRYLRNTGQMTFKMFRLTEESPLRHFNGIWSVPNFGL